MNVCPSCGHENREQARFCEACGAAFAAPAPPREERKVVSVLFADLVGFTSRAEQMDPEDVRALLSPYYARLRSELERFGGTVEKFIGDAVMALFGAPVAHEDDPERAVRAALAIRDWVLEQPEELQVRLAVTTGEALVALRARPSEGEGMASGDVVNTAARLQAAAPVNGILVDEPTQRATKDAIVYRATEPVAAKGKAELIRVWHAVEPRARLGLERLHGASLVGRSRELALLTDALERVRQQHSPQLITLVGVPGIGKSRLVFELAQAADADPEPISWRQGRCLPYGEGVTFWALAEIVKAQAGILESDPPEEVERKLREAAGEPWVESQLRPLVGLATDDLGGERGESFAAWRQFFEALAEERPLVLVLEDLHWGNDDLLDFVDYLLDWASGVPILVVCTARPELLERRPGWGGGKANALTISLSPLADEETARLLAELLERPLLPAETQASLLARAGGNPLYAEQFARMLRERGAEEELPLPETVQGIIAARLDLLEPDQKALLQDAAVLGKTFWAGGLAAVAGRERRAVEERLHALERKEFLRRERRSAVAEETQYFFLHLLVRDVAYGQIPRGQRAEKHRRAAHWIESLGRPEDHAEMLAHHYASGLELARASGQATDELSKRTRFALRDAGDRALALHAGTAAARFYKAALDLWPQDDPDRAALLFRYGATAYEIAALIEARDALLERGDRESAAESEAEISVLHWFRGERELSSEHVQRAAELLTDAPPSRAKAQVLHQVARHHMLAAEYEAAIEVAREAIRMAEALDLAEIHANALNTVGCARFNRGDEAGLGDLERSIALATDANSPVVVRAYVNLGALLFCAGELRRASEVQEEGRRQARRFGQLLQLRFLEDHRAEELYWTGRWDESEELASRRIAESEQGSPDYSAAGFRCDRGLIRLARGDAEGALADARAALAEARRVRDPQMLEPALATCARITAAVGQHEEAAALVDEALASWLGIRGQSFGLCWAVGQLGRAGRFLEALEHQALRTRWKDPARLAADGAFVRAAELYAEIGSLPDEALARLRAAQAGDLDQLERALAFYRSVGAARYIREGEALLAASA